MATIKQIDPIRVRAFVPYEDYAAARAAVGLDKRVIDQVDLTLILPDGSEWQHKGRLISSGYEFEEETQRLVTARSEPPCKFKQRRFRALLPLSATSSKEATRRAC
jgi:hypothetical protein